MMPGALTSTRARLSALIGPLPSIGIAERVDDAAEQALADRHVDDRAGALDGLAFLDLAVGAEDDDADIVAFEIERHAARAVLELDHLAGLHVVEAVGAGDAVADGEHLADFGDFGLLAEILDLLFQDVGNFCGANIHQRASFIAILIALSLVRRELSTMRLPTLTISPPMMAGSILTSKSMSLPPVTDLSALLSASTFCVAELLGDGDLRGDLALVAGNQRAIAADHVAHGEQPPVGGDDAQEVGGDALDAGLVEDGAERGQLLVGAEHRAAHQAGKIGVAGNQRVERVEILLDRIGRLLFERELEQGVGVAARHAGNDGVFACHLDALLVNSLHRPGAFPERRRKSLESKRKVRTGGASPQPREIVGLANTARTAVQHCAARAHELRSAVRAARRGDTFASLACLASRARGL